MAVTRRVCRRGVQNLPLSTITGDHNYIKGNSKFFSVAGAGGGGPIYVVPYSNVGKMPNSYPSINGHAGAVYDTDWCVHRGSLRAPVRVGGAVPSKPAPYLATWRSS